MMNTLFLMPSTWDFALDIDGNMALAKEPYAQAQDVASAIKLFKGELYYDTRKGIPHFEEMLGRKPSYSLWRYHVEQAALTVPNVVQSKADFILRNNRVVEGAVTFIDKNGKANGVQL
jgi:hypothetical protein